MKYLLAFLILASINIKAQNNSIEFIDNDWKQAIENSKEFDKLIFVDAYTTWCGPCKWMAANIFTNDTIAEFYNSNYINLKLDMEKGEGLEFAKQFGIRSYPTLLYINANQELVHRSVGAYPKIEWYIDNGLDAMNPLERYSSFEKSYGDGARGKEFMVEFISKSQVAGIGVPDAIKELYLVLSDKELMEDEIWEITKASKLSFESKAIAHLQSNIDLYNKQFGGEAKTVLEDSYKNFLMTAVYARPFNDEKYKEARVKVLGSDLKNANEVVFYTDLIMYQKTGNWKLYEKNIVAGTEKYYLNNASVLNNIAWTIFENIEAKAILKKAVSWAEKSIELSESHYTYDTLANLQYKLNLKKEAIESLTMAIQLSKDEGLDFANYEETLSTFK
jgi:thiol-disulfide isomerase/thioredoxin